MSPLYKPLRQRDYFRRLGSTFSSADAPETLVLSPKASIRRDVLEAWDIDPRVIDPRGEEVDRQVGKRTFANPALLCSRIPHGAVATAAGVVVTEDGRWIVDSVGHVADHVVAQSTLRRIRVSEPTYVDEDVALIYSLLSEKKHANYYHWVVEGLSRLSVLLAAGVPPSIRFLVPEPVHELHLNSLAAFGIDESRVLGWSGKPRRFRSVYLPSGPQHLGATPIAAAISLLREHAGGPSERRPQRRLWISRRLSRRRRRRLSGEDELLAVARAFGFEEVVAEELTPREQMDLFAQAGTVAGIHGAGLTNAVFMAPGGAVVEVAPESLKPRQKPLFWNLAAAAGQRYGYCVGPAEGVDPARFERVLATLVT